MADTVTAAESVRTATMKKLEIIIKPGKLETVRKAIESMGCAGVTISQAEGHGKQKGVTTQFQGGAFKLDVLPKVKLEVVIADTDLERVIEAVTQAARTGQVGDGKIFVSDVQEVIRIRTGERGQVAV